MSDEPSVPPPDVTRAELRPTDVISGTHFASLLRAVRLASGIKPADLAAQLDIKYGTVYAREAGRRAVSIDDAVAHLAACGYVLRVQHREAVS